MPVLLYWLFGGAAAAAGVGYLAKSSADAVTETSNTAIKVAIVGGALFLAAKHYKII